MALALIILLTVVIFLLKFRVPCLITSNLAVWNWARGSLIDYQALQKCILELFFVLPVLETPPTDAAEIDSLKRTYGIPPDVTKYCIVTKGFNYAVPGVRGAIMLKLFALHFRNAKEIAPLGPTDFVQQIPWKIPKFYR